MRHLVELAARRVPYYREAWRGVHGKAIRSAADLPLLPRLDKQTIRQNARAFLADGLRPASLWVASTSGTTGTSLGIYWPYDMLPKWWATWRPCGSMARSGWPVTLGDRGLGRERASGRGSAPCHCAR